MAPSSPPSSGQTLDHPPSPSPSSDLHHTPASPETHTSNISSVGEKSVSIASASAVESKKLSQAGFPFLSLPPEIRSMIYHHIFTPVRDGTCWMIYTDYFHTRLRGFRRDCYSCSFGTDHGICLPEMQRVEGLRAVLGITDNYTHSGILQTCHAILKEAMPISLTHMHISLDNISAYAKPCEALMMLFANMHQPQGAYLSRLTYVCYDHRNGPGDPKALSSIINQLNLRLGSLDLFELSWESRAHRYRFLTHFVGILESLDNLPGSVRWLNVQERWYTDFDEQKLDFNNAVVVWREKLATVNAAELDTSTPLLRDFLPQYFNQSSD